MIKRIHIENYKSLRQVEVSLKPLSVLFGPNAAGKSNFIDSLQLLSRIVNCETLGKAFDPPYRGKPSESFTFTPDNYPGHWREGANCFEIEVDVEISKAVILQVESEIAQMEPVAQPAVRSVEKQRIKHNLLRYRIKVSINPNSGFLFVEDEYLAALSKKGNLDGSRKPFLELDKERDRFCLRLEGQSHPFYLDRRLDYSVLSRPHFARHYPHVTAFKRELKNWQFYYFEPREKMRTPASPGSINHVGLMGEELAGYLHYLRSSEPKKFANVEKTLKYLIPSISELQTFINQFGEVELNVVESGVPISARLVSEGTLRMLGLLSLEGSRTPPSLIGFEEPENGVHPERIREIANLIIGKSESDSQTQMIVTTHSPVLLDQIPVEDLFLCKKEGGGTLIEPLQLWGPLDKHNKVDSGLLDQLPPVSERMLRGDYRD
ncbi:MAG: AAA family ATPase [Terracidiphilus sp.]